MKHYLAANENPFGTCQAVRDVIQTFDAPHLYPDPDVIQLRKAIGDTFHVPFQNILCGCGSEDLLHTIIQTFAGSGDEIVMPQYAFCVYEIAARNVGATPISVPRDSVTMALSVDAILACITPRTKIVCLDHPGNPIGNYLDKDALDKLVTKLPADIVLIIDSAYAEYMAPYDDYSDGMAYVMTRSNVIVTRSFSKAYGLAGLRLGWLFAPDALMTRLMKIRAPFKTSGIAQKAGRAALSDFDFVNKSVAHVHIWRKSLEDLLKFYGLLPFEGCANFTLCRFPDAEKAQAFADYLENAHIYVKILTQYKMPNYVRISIGSEESMVYLMDHIRKYMA